MRFFYLFIVSLMLLSVVLGEVSSTTETRFFIDDGSDTMNSGRDGGSETRENGMSFTLILLILLVALIFAYYVYHFSKKRKRARVERKTKSAGKKKKTKKKK